MEGGWVALVASIHSSMFLLGATVIVTNHTLITITGPLAILAQAEQRDIELAASWKTYGRGVPHLQHRLLTRGCGPSGLFDCCDLHTGLSLR